MNLIYAADPMRNPKTDLRVRLMTDSSYVHLDLVKVIHGPCEDKKGITAQNQEQEQVMTPLFYLAR